MQILRVLWLAATIVLGGVNYFAYAQDKAEATPPVPSEQPSAAPEGADAQTDMTLERLGELINRVGTDIVKNGNRWQFTVAETPAFVVTDPTADRMRIMIAISEADSLSQDMHLRLMQANFDSALDARYAIAQNILWSTFIHPLSPLSEGEFLSGLGQTINLKNSYGKTYSSGAVVYGGGDSQELLGRQLIDELLRKGGEKI